MYVICTAGHVDHGKSTLVKALTGMEPDRLAEERRRSMTIDLGFAWFDLAPSDSAEPWTVAFVDLPGHHRFLGNMLAGASSVAIALLVVSADDGPMPQTFEHLEILDLLGVEHGVVALTKTDLVDETTVEFGVELIREALAGTSLARAPVVPVSGATGHNLEALRKALRSVLATLPVEEDVGRPRLWVDRSFSVRGAGTVVTGTLRQGALAVDDEVMVLPGQRAARIRGLQSLGRQLDHAVPGGRVAINLVGPGRGEVRRGDAVVRSRQWHDVRVFEGWVRALPDRPILRRGDWHLHCGSGEWRVELRPVNGRTVAAGDEGAIRVELADAIPVAPGDRFVLRESGRQMTIGGGVVLDIAPGRPARGRSDRESRTGRLARRLEALRADDRLALVVDHAQAHGFVNLRDVVALAGLGGQPGAMASDDRLLNLGSALVDALDAHRWRLAAVEAVRRHHANHPLERAVPKDVAVHAAVDAGCAPTVAPHLVAHAVDRGELAAEGAGVRLPTYRVQLDEGQAKAAEHLIDLLDAGGFAPPDLQSALAEAGAAEVVRELEASGRLVRVAPHIAMTSEMLDRAHDLLREAFVQEGPLTASRAREVLATTRKYVLPLLAALDQRGCTRRQGDLRIVLDVEHHA